MEKPFAYIGAAVICLTLTFNVYAEDSSKKPGIPDYWACTPDFHQIDYSYLMNGEWDGEELREKIRSAIEMTNDHPNNVELDWGLVNCIN